MAEWGFLEWFGVLAGGASILGLLLVLRKRKAKTINIATGSRGVEQTGGAGETRNETKDSSDVKQSG